MSQPPLPRLDPTDVWKPWRPDARRPWNLKWVGHLYRRAAFGATWADLQTALADGPDTAVARLLAGELGWGWADADEALEKCHGRSVRGIFEAEGESGFREKESAILPELCGLERHVVATGGGVVLREANRELLRNSGWVVWLTADVDT